MSILMNNNFLVSEVMMTLEKCPVVSENEILKEGGKSGDVKKVDE